jgi:AraC family transcriptional regulator of adaptative response / DNA-3-methyladenine glycosylase II
VARKAAVETPKRENVTFYPTASAAQEAGFRPCLRCRPECSPDLAVWRGTSNTVSRALALIADGALDQAAVDARPLKCGSTVTTPCAPSSATVRV